MPHFDNMKFLVEAKKMIVHFFGRTLEALPKSAHNN